MKRIERIVDAHHHLWDLEVNRYPWLTGPMHDRGWGDLSPLQRSYGVADLIADIGELPVVKSVHVQANFDPSNPVGESAWLESVADDPASRGFPQAIVGYANLAAPDFRAVLEAHARHPRVRGIRQVLNRHADPSLNRAPEDFLEMPRWRENLGALREHGFSFDAQVYFGQMASLAALACRHEDVVFVLDHAGMPAERDEAAIAGWRQAMRELAACPNVNVKLSGYGMVDRHWTVESLRPFVLGPIEWFGPRRAMFASNFPVDRLMSSYERLWAAYDEIVADFSVDERRELFAGTAERVYRLR